MLHLTDVCFGAVKLNVKSPYRTDDRFYMVQDKPNMYVGLSGFTLV